jgi:formamidopyrimidine-DNA glycosylase
MPELPDLVHIVKALGPQIEGRRITRVAVKESIVLRLLVPGRFEELLTGCRFDSLERHGPFLRFGLTGDAASGTEGAAPHGPAGGTLDLVMHLMLAGRLRLSPPVIAPSEKLGATKGQGPLAHTAFALGLDDGRTLFYGDEKKMGKIYLCEAGRFEPIPGYLTQGIDVTSPAFTYEAFSALIAKKRCQARVFVMDQTSLSAVGNAYADEILFEARIHPKTPCYSLDEHGRRALYDAIKSVLAWGIAEVERAGRALEEKVRGHMRVRGRSGEPCPRCGATIRKAGVLGFDACFCPICQPDRTGRGLDWTKLPPREVGE